MHFCSRSLSFFVRISIAVLYHGGALFLRKVALFIAFTSHSPFRPQNEQDKKKRKLPEFTFMMADYKQINNTKQMTAHGFHLSARVLRIHPQIIP